jgi:uncharacterized protein (DUF2141 family)
MRHKYQRMATLGAIGGVIAAAIAVIPPAARANSAANELRVEVTGLKSDRGDVIFALYNSAESFTKKAYKTAVLKIDDDRCEWVLNDLPHGDYAVVIVHDENGNQDMDRNLLGIPKEPYAFSNNVKARFHAPAFDAAKFSVGPGEATVKISLE